MGSCLGTLIPRGVLGTPRRRKGSPNGSIPPSDDSDNKHLPDDVNSEHLPNDLHSKHVSDVAHDKRIPNDSHNGHLPDVAHEKRVPDESHNGHLPDDVHNEHLPDDIHDRTKDVASKQRALLVGITYTGPFNTWSQLDGPHGDVDQYRDLLISA